LNYHKTYKNNFKQFDTIIISKMSTVNGNDAGARLVDDNEDGGST